MDNYVDMIIRIDFIIIIQLNILVIHQFHLFTLFILKVINRVYFNIYLNALKCNILILAYLYNDFVRNLFKVI